MPAAIRADGLATGLGLAKVGNPQVAWLRALTTLSAQSELAHRPAVNYHEAAISIGGTHNAAKIQRG